MNRSLLLVAVIFFQVILLLDPAMAGGPFAFVTTTDSWTVNEGDSSDNVVWGGESLQARVVDSPSDSDILCFDYDGDDFYSQCWAAPATDEDICDSHFTIPSEPSGTNVVPSTLYLDNIDFDVLTKTMDTGSDGDAFSQTIKATIFAACDTGNPREVNVLEREFHVVNRHRYECAESPLIDPDYRGRGSSWETIEDNTGICSSSQACDSNHDGDYSTDKAATLGFGLSNPCRTLNGFSCSSDDDCISDTCIANTCVDSSILACFADLNVVGSMSGLQVYVNGVHQGQTDIAHFFQGNIETKSCGTGFNIDIRCQDNVTTCYSDTVFANDEEEVLSVIDNGICSMLCLSEPNLQIEDSSVLINNDEVNFIIYSSQITDAISVEFSGLNNLGELVSLEEFSVNVTAGEAKNHVFSSEFDDYVTVFLKIDVLEEFDEFSEEDNIVSKPIYSSVPDAYIEVQTGYEEIDQIILEYLDSFVNIVDSDQSDVKISIGKFTDLYSSSLTSEGLVAKDSGVFPVGELDWGYRFRAVYSEGLYGTQPYSNVVGRTHFNNSDLVLGFGTDLVGEIASVKTLIEHKSYLFSDLFGSLSDSTFSIPPQVKEPIFASGADVNSLVVYDRLQPLLQNPDIGVNSQAFSDAVRDILFENTYDVAIRSVRTTDQTSYGEQTVLRLKNINAELSPEFRSALIGSNFRPVVFSGGIFADLESWEGSGNGLAREMAEEGWDVWEIEMNSGPTTDCDDCPNYLYEDQYLHYWPTLIAGVIAYSNSPIIDYVGHSNGCRVALSSLNEYSGQGKVSAGEFFNYDTGEYNQLFLPEEPINKFFGVGCPALLNDKGQFDIYTNLARSTTLNLFDPAARRVMQSLEGQAHVSNFEFITGLISEVAPQDIITPGVGNIPYTLLGFIGPKISYNLMNFYSELAIDSNSAIDLNNVNVDELYVFGTYSSDYVVPYNDSTYIVEQSTSAATKEVFNQTSLGIVPENNPSFLRTDHVSMTDQRKIKDKIKEVLE